MIVDTHLHYTPKDEHGHGDTVEEVLAAARAAGIDKIVQITPSAAGYDNAYGLEGAQKYPSGVIGVFGRIDPTTPDLAQRLTEHMAQPGMIGVRIQARKKTPSEAWLKERTLDPLLTLCQERNIPVGFYPPDQPKELRETAHRFPALRVVAEQMTLYAVKGITDVYHQWDEVLKLAQEPNVWTKISLFPQAAPKEEHYPFPTSQARFKQLYELVGPTRLIWGSNFPSVEEVCTYKQALEFVTEAAGFIPKADRTAIVGQNFLDLMKAKAKT